MDGQMKTRAENPARGRRERAAGKGRAGTNKDQQREETTRLTRLCDKGIPSCTLYIK